MDAGVVVARASQYRWSTSRAIPFTSADAPLVYLLLRQKGVREILPQRRKGKPLETRQRFASLRENLSGGQPCLLES